MKLLKVSLCAAVASFALTGVAAAAEWSFNLGVSNAYMFRGVKQTTGDCCGEDGIQVFGGADVTFDGGFYAGTWLTNTGPSFDNGIEYDIYGGWKSDLGPFAVDVGLIYYGYTNSDLGFVSDNWNTTELKLAASMPLGGATVGAAAYYTDDQAGTSQEQLYLEANVTYTLSNMVTLSGAVGEVSCDCMSPDNYTTWNAGVTVPVSDKLTLDGRYIANSQSAQNIFGPTIAPDSKVVVTLKATF